VRIKTLYVRFYKSFNYDYLRKSHPDAQPDPWDLVAGGDLFYPFIRVPLERGITTVVGANESGRVSSSAPSSVYSPEGESSLATSVGTRSSSLSARR
jgi:hypothetical protein